LNADLCNANSTCTIASHKSQPDGASQTLTDLCLPREPSRVRCKPCCANAERERL